MCNQRLNPFKIQTKLYQVIVLSIVWGVIGQTGDLKREYETVCNSYGFELYIEKFGKEKHYLCLKSKSVGVSTGASAVVLLDPEPTCDAERFTLHHVTMAHGFPADSPSSGTADGYIGEDGHFRGVLHIGENILYADPFDEDNGTNFGVFENDNLVVSKTFLHDHVQSRSIEESQYTSSDFPYLIQETKPVAGVAKSRVCDLLLLADKEFYETEGNHSLQQVVKRMMHAVSQADVIFRNADFDENGIPDNIGFSVKYILVLTSTETNSRVFGDLLNTKLIDGREYLMKFARLRRLSEVCLGVAFSGHAFMNRTLGLSFTSLGDGIGGAAGGLCDRRAYGRSFNTLAISHATMEHAARVPERVAALTLTHEMGHSFGAHHDDNFPNPECRGFLMSSQSVAGDSSKHFEFSICSKRLVAATLSSMSYCLTEENVPYCGNGIVEVGEACDCGLPTYCHLRDPCCTPRSGGVQENGRIHIEGCSVAPSAKCHPSQGLCCKSDCHFANLTSHGIDCSQLSKTCPCANASEACPCGHGGLCTADGSCEARECAALGLRECTCTGNLGGTLGEKNLCGVCCLLPSGEADERCAGAEEAALHHMARTRALPDQWPGLGGPGDKALVEVRLCIKEMCRTAFLRAWRPHGLCVTMNMVGSCTALGACKPQFVQPNTNRFPDIKKVKYIQAMHRSQYSPCVRGSVNILFTTVSVLYLTYIILF